MVALPGMPKLYSQSGPGSEQLGGRSAHLGAESGRFNARHKLEQLPALCGPEPAVHNWARPAEGHCAPVTHVPKTWSKGAVLRVALATPGRVAGQMRPAWARWDGMR